MSGSRLPGFHEQTLAERARMIAERLENPELRALLGTQTLSLEIAEKLSENVVGIFGLPLSIATNFVINGQEILIPMSVEEPSVVAAASFGAKLARAGGGFFATSDPAEMIGQIELRDVPEVDAAIGRIKAAEARLLAHVDALHPRLKARGGGALGLDVRTIEPDEGHLVCEVAIDCRDAMGANLINTACEALAGPLAELSGGVVGLRILSNFCVRRRARARVEIPLATLGEGVAEGVALASRFASRDVHRAVTHNKGFMNGVDALVVATGNDWRAIEAAAHAFAVKDGVYRPLSQWWVVGEKLVGEGELPLALGTVGGATQAHPGARLALELMGKPGSRALAEICVSVGLAQNLSALRALATDGIQKGHMALHARRLDVAAAKPRATYAAEQRFMQWLSPRAASIEGALARFFVEREGRVGSELRGPLGALKELTLRGGKRLRGALVLLGYELATHAEAPEAALQASAAIELLQSGLLIQHDLSRGDEVRRHGPALHHLLANQVDEPASGPLTRGGARALVVAQLARLYASEVITRAPFALERRMAALEDLLALEASLWGGEWRELALDPRDATEDEVLRGYEMRGGRLTAGGPLRLGARLGGAADALLAAIETYARPIGIVFQIRDDVLRTFGDARETGMSSGTELRSVRPRLLLVEALRRGSVAEVARLHELLAHPRRTEEEIAEVRALLVSTGGRDAAIARAEALLAEARAAAGHAAFPEAVRPLLVDLADFTLDRNR